ncbi:MAG: hypothetical protein A2Y62_22215 [Candidatus Fischerbacteria bacterium RBG_13_37_8]|uniref:Cell division protein FtsB n=1 Tax=Candidatus Fischerbacteria bacterium RBG_13_37_8 TaxID=1817863 RepID=A0A1F5VJH3_9BACT|nr:MAG: hypothetical protein A2Y62_22215 [Candidatus Fischerbacteria bacterium RBG_13_37_8]
MREERQKGLLKEKKYSRYRKIFLAVIAFFLIVLAQGIFGDKGFMVLLEARKAKESLNSEIKRLEAENNRLRKEIMDLKNNKFAIEKKAREKLLYSNDGEIIVLTPPAEEEQK